ncbi:hypothetical protein M378DRAFT_114782 [Amanita muscaria Koide BX008]|uniref:Copper homeostasis protein cutC homolog n=1 Tax=Amanita muscaria (strain Koide BX008) TaxID=946122 RepID=A0A0C2T6G6_AMAMK|nr:hypothetical protein M378DRAFT_114782 [Amanita muscaria Koide BX008]
MSEVILPVNLEVCVDSVESAMSAVRGGADRLELCANLGNGGGTTPSVGLLIVIQNTLGEFPIMVMIRPRTGDFVYSEEEIAVMLEDIRIFKKFGVRGVVIGALTPEGRVDLESTKKLIDEALPLEVCFHRAFDMTRNPEEALQDLASIGGIARILTSGHGKTAPNSLGMLKRLFHTKKELVTEPWGLSILPGSGINKENVAELLDFLVPLGLKEVHLSGGLWVEGPMSYRREGMAMGFGDGEWNVWRTQEEKVQEVKIILNSHCQEHAALYPLSATILETELTDL